MIFKQESEKGDGVLTVHLDITLSRDEFERLTMMLGMACGAMSKEGMTEISWNFVRLANKIMEGNPDWHPYPVPAEELITHG